MNIAIVVPVLASIGGSIYYFKKRKLSENNANYDDIEILESDIDADCPVIFFDNNGNYYYVYK